MPDTPSVPPPPPSAAPPPPPPPSAGDSGPRQPAKPLWKRWWFIAAAVIVAIGVIGSLGTDAADAPSDAAEVAAHPAASDRASEASEPAVVAEPDDADGTASSEDPAPIEVPDVAGMSEAEATRTIEAAGLQPDIETQDVTRLEDQGKVLEQRPPAGREVQVDATITVVVGGDFVWQDTILVEGSGDDVVDVAIPDDEIAIVRLAHSGSANFAIWSIGEAGDQQDLLVNTIATYQGVRLINLEEPTRQLEITANGPWTVEFAPLAQARRLGDTGSIEGNGDDVVIADASAPEASKALLSNSGDANFAIWAHAESGTDLLVNDIGPYEGTVRWPGGVVILDVTATGAWSIDLE